MVGVCICVGLGDMGTEIRRINQGTLEQASDFGGVFCGDAFKIAANKLGCPSDIVRSRNHGGEECAATSYKLLYWLKELVAMKEIVVKKEVDMLREFNVIKGVGEMEKVHIGRCKQTSVDTK